MTPMHVSGRVWRFGDEIDTDVILPSQYVAAPDPAVWVEHLMEPVFPGFAAQLTGKDIIVAGEHFGSGSSREHAAIALKVAGIGAIVAASFSTIFHRNAINNGLLVIECPEAAAEAAMGDELSIDVDALGITNRTRGQTYQFAPISPFVLDILRAGGLRPY